MENAMSEEVNALKSQGTYVLAVCIGSSSCIGSLFQEMNIFHADFTVAYVARHEGRTA